MGKRHIFAYNARHSDALEDAAGPGRSGGRETVLC